MKLLLDTHVLLWAAGQPERLPREAAVFLEDLGHELVFSVASLWEIVIKSNLGRSDFAIDASLLRRGLREAGYLELEITTSHVLALIGLPPLNKDPFDRMLIAQSLAEGMLLLTMDAKVAAYPAPVRRR